MKKKALVVYYTQSGQLKNIIDAVITPLQDDFDFVFEELKPEPEFPFPWKGMSFYQSFPESVQEIPCRLQPFSFNPDEDFDLVILGYQPWYLSPSIPVSSFLRTNAARKVMNGKPVITILGCRNMWVMAQERIKERIALPGGKLVGNIVLADRHPNLVSVITIVRWMLKGEKKGKGLYGHLFPESGVDREEIRAASKFGGQIRKSFDENKLDTLQNELLALGAVDIKPVLLAIEKRGYMMFRPWSEFVLRKGGAGDPAREGRLRMFRAYLFAVIYLVSPFGSIVFRLIYTLNPGKKRKMIQRYAKIT
ncbi:MAG: hypothetical protein RQ761_06510 [Bacteroidales bacterium]|nr:hypothetical protein [Bacteroidales bacterium]